jgi:hypothetical protein
LLVCLGLLEHAPERFEAAAVAWHARFCMVRSGLRFADAQATLSALERLRSPECQSAAASLCEFADECGRDDVRAVLTAWMQKEAAGEPAAIGTSGGVADQRRGPVADEAVAHTGAEETR